MNRVAGLLGLTARAGKIQSGEQAAELALKKGQAKLVILDGAASKGTCKAFTDACTYYSIPIRITDADGCRRAGRCDWQARPQNSGRNRRKAG